MTHQEVKAALLARQKPERAAILARFFKTAPGQYGEGDLFLGLSMPEQRAVVRQYTSLPTEDVIKLVHDPYHECRMVGLLIWVWQSQRANPNRKQHLAEQYVAQRAYINNWDLVDVTCPYVLGQALLPTDRSILYDLADENHLWSQRIAIVSTLAFIRKNQFADTLALAEKLLPHRHDLIHKAVGWMLREVGKRNEEALEEFLRGHHKHMPRTALRYAIERLSPAKRRAYLQR